MICANCKYYSTLIEDDDDWCGTPWCMLVQDALPDPIFAPFDCICPEEKRKADSKERR